MRISFWWSKMEKSSKAARTKICFVKKGITFRCIPSNLRKKRPHSFFALKPSCGAFVFDPTELPIITIYLMYLPMFIQWMRKEKDQPLLKRFIMPALAFCGSVFMVIACIVSHKWGCFWYLIVFAVVMFFGWLVNKKKKIA